MPSGAIDPLIDDLLSIGERELGASQMLHLVTRLALQAGPVAAMAALDQGERFSEAAAEELRAELWQGLWRSLAAARPSAFALDPARLTLQQASPLALAYLYAKRREPLQLQPFTPTAAEGVLLDGARAKLAALTGLTSLDRPCDVVVFSEQCQALHSVYLLDRGEAYSLCEEPRLRRVVLLDGRVLARERARGVEGVRAVATLVLHEEIHAALAVASGQRTGLSDELAFAVNEGAVSLLETAAFAALDSGDFDAALVGHPYERQAAALYAVARPADLGELCLTSVSLARVALGARSRGQVCQHLNELAHERSSETRWQTALCDS